jgi:hypothetical protein
MTCSTRPALTRHDRVEEGEGMIIFRVCGPHQSRRDDLALMAISYVARYGSERDQL